MLFNVGGASMGYQWSLDTSGDPLGKVRSVIKEAWTVSGLDGMLVTLYGAAETHAQPRLVTEIEAIDQVNPFRPLMQVNAARLLPDILAAHPNSRIGAVLRPCEMRALVEMTKHTALDLDRLLTISVDCLGTLPANPGLGPRNEKTTDDPTWMFSGCRIR
jgi:formate dehydrogenase subunit beta